MKVSSPFNFNHDCKTVLQVYLPAIVGYVPDDMVKCLAAFLDASYIARRQDIDTNALDALDAALTKFWTLREVFRYPGVRPKGFSLPRQHALSHYRRLIEDFGAPGGLCSSITESRHITAVKKPWRRSNRFHALGQMLQINQRLDKLAAMRSNFMARGMLPAGYSLGRSISFAPDPQHLTFDNGDEDDDEEGPVEKEDVLGHVVLARTRGELASLTEQDLSDPSKRATIHRTWRGFPSISPNQIYHT
jgi:hypothetical protein